MKPTLLYVSFVVCAVSGFLASCAQPTFREVGPSRDTVLRAASDVVTERYPMSTTSHQGGYVFAVTPAQVEGGARTKRQISVLIQKNYTGAYEPIVRIRHDLDVSTPEVDAVDLTSAVNASPFATKERWRPMGYLPYEEEELAQAILAKIRSTGL